LLANAPAWTDAAQLAVLAGQLILLAVAAFIARAQASEARTLRLEQVRPFVVIDFDHDKSIFLLTVENRGPILGHDITFEVDPPFATAHKFPIGELSWFKSGIKSLAPGKKLTTLFDSSIERHPDNRTAKDLEVLPDVYRVTVRYTDPTGKRHFEERQVLDLGAYWGLTRIERKDISDIHKRFEELLRELKKWTAPGFGGGLLTLSPVEVVERDEAISREFDERRNQTHETGEPESG
jgi:hypothetical protein